METKKDPIFAAGGILWRGEPLLSDIAVIHRKRHGSEWCLPKGKEIPEDNCSLEATAIREVKEETGCTAVIIGFAGSMEYPVDDEQKQVFFWHMKLSGKCELKCSEEVDKIIWLPPSEAVKILTHPDQVEIVKKAMQTIPHKQKVGFPGFTKTLKYRRLAGSILSYRTEIINRSDNYSDPLEKSKELLNKAEISLRQRNYDEAWKCFHGAQRMEIFLLRGEELKYKAETIVNEAEKLSSWRKGAVEGLLGKPGSIKKPLSHEQVYEAALIRDEHYNNTAYKGGMLKSHIAELVTITSIILVLILTEILTNWLASINFMPIAGVILYGLLGGAFSAVLKVPTSMSSSRIPELTHSLRLTLLRIFIGATSALIIYQFIQSDFSKNMFELSITHIQTFYIIAFVSGFSERMVLKAVSIVNK